MIAGAGGAVDAEPGIVARQQQIGGIDGLVGDDAAQCAAAVQQRRGAAHDFNALDQRRIEEGAADVAGIGTTADAVDQRQHAVLP